MIISVHAKPGSRKPGIERRADGAWQIRVSQRALAGKANDAICHAIAEELKIAASRVRLISGAKSKIKRFEIPDGIISS